MELKTKKQKPVKCHGFPNMDINDPKGKEADQMLASAWIELTTDEGQF